MRLSTILVGLAVGALLVPSGGATHPDSHGLCPSSSQYIPRDSETRSYPVYQTDDGSLTSDEWWEGIPWIYAESNGVTGLQRDDDYCYTEGYTTETSDTIIF